MLTSMYYYGYWRPYIVGEADAPAALKAPSLKKTRSAKTVYGDSQPILLNKSMSRETVEFAKDIYRSVVSLKEAARSALFSSDRYGHRSSVYGEGAAKEYLGYGLSDFADSYNAASGFLPLQEHSAELVRFFDGISGEVEGGAQALARLGIRRDGGKLSYSSGALENLSAEDAERAVEDARPFLERIYEGALDVMKKPMTAHMEFKSFRYYYNYQTGVTKQDTFSVMGTGTMVDIAL